MGEDCQFHRLVALKPQGVETRQQINWQVWTLLVPVPRLGKLHRLATREEREHKLGAANSPGLSTSSCSTNGRSQLLSDAISLTLSGQRGLLPPSGS